MVLCNTRDHISYLQICYIFYPTKFTCIKIQIFEQNRGRRRRRSYVFKRPSISRSLFSSLFLNSASLVGSQPGSVTKWLEYLSNIWPETTIKIFPKALNLASYLD